MLMPVLVTSKYVKISVLFDDVNCYTFYEIAVDSQSEKSHVQSQHYPSDDKHSIGL